MRREWKQITCGRSADWIGTKTYGKSNLNTNVCHDWKISRLVCYDNFNFFTLHFLLCHAANRIGKRVWISARSLFRCVATRRNPVIDLINLTIYTTQEKKDILDISYRWSERINVTFFLFVSCFSSRLWSVTSDDRSAITEKFSLFFSFHAPSIRPIESRVWILTLF